VRAPRALLSGYCPLGAGYPDSRPLAATQLRTSQPGGRCEVLRELERFQVHAVDGVQILGAGESVPQMAGNSVEPCMRKRRPFMHERQVGIVDGETDGQRAVQRVIASEETRDSAYSLWPRHAMTRSV